MKYGAEQRVELNHDEDSLSVALIRKYCYVLIVTQHFRRRFEITWGQLYTFVQTGCPSCCFLLVKYG